MSRSTYNPRESYIGNGLLDTYAFAFRIEALSQLELVVYDDSDEEVERVRGTDTVYIDTVTFGATSGTVKLQANLPNNYTLIILLANDAPTQPFEFRNKGDFSLDRIELALDWVVGPIQRAIFLCLRSARLPDNVTTADFDPTLPFALIGSPRVMLTTNDTGTGFSTGPGVSVLEEWKEETLLARNQAVAAAEAAVEAADSIGDSVAAAEEAAQLATDKAAEAHQSALDAAASAAAAGGAPYIEGERAIPIGVTDIDGIQFGTIKYMNIYYVEGNGGPVDLSALNPQILPGNYHGQRLVLHGCSDTNTIKIAHANGVKNKGLGDVILFADSLAEYLWNDVEWVQLS